VPNIRRRLRVQHPPWADSQQLNLSLFGIALGGVRAGGGAGAVCGAVSSATKNEQMMREGEDLQIQDRPATESASKSRDDGTHELKPAGDTWPSITKPLDFSDRSEFLVATSSEAMPAA
jgi:hypothetical protein